MDKLALCVLLGCVGCYRSSALGEAGDAAVDASVDAWSVDAGMRASTQLCECCGASVEWPSDIPCELGACDDTCVSSCTPAEASIMEVSIRNDGTRWQVGVGAPDLCFCGETIDCRGEIVADHVVELRVSMCAGLPCDACIPFVEGECEMPAMDEGMWRVVQNGVDAFGPVQVAPAGSSIELSPRIWQSRTEGSQRYESMQWPPTPRADVREVCVGSSGNLSAVVVETCEDCRHSVIGSCRSWSEPGRVYVETSTQTPLALDTELCPGCRGAFRHCHFRSEDDTFELIVDGDSYGPVSRVEELCF